MWDENLVTEKRLVLCPIKSLLDADATVRSEVYELAYVHFPLFKGGHLLVRGAISDQPAWWLEAMMFLETLDLRKKAAFTKAREQDANGE